MSNEQGTNVNPDGSILEPTSNEERQEGVPAEQTAQAPSEEQPEQHLIPEQYVGKSPAELIQIIREKDKYAGRLANDLGSTRKEREELEQKWQEAQRYQSAPEAPVYQQQVAPTAPTPEQDPLSVFEETFDEDPKLAIKKALAGLAHKQEATLTQAQIQQRQDAANKYYWEQKQNNPDFARREPLMQQALGRVSHLVKPEFVNSAEMMQLLDLVSKGMDLGYYEKQAAAAAQRNGSAVVDEKRRAQSESGAPSTGSGMVSIDDMSTDELEAYIGVSRKYN